MRDAPPFVLAAMALDRHARVTVDSIYAAVDRANGYANAIARTEILGVALALREEAARLDRLVGIMEGQLSERKRQGTPVTAPLEPRKP